MNALRGIGGRSYSYSDEDHLLTAGSVSYTYDADGFLTAKINGSDNVTGYSYSSRGELLKVTLPDGTAIEYVHDPLGRRIAKKIDGVIVEKYLWQGLTRLLAIYDGADNLLMRFEYADGRLPVAMASGGKIYYLTYDQVGSLRLVADSSGNVVKSLEYDSFGNILNDSNPIFAMPFGFAGGLHDRDTGLGRFGYRDYDPDTGRWTAKDPIGFAGGDTDLYGYVLNDPVNWVDPSGLIDAETIRTAALILCIVDVAPIGAIPGIPQVIGEAIDVAAALSTQAVLVADLATDRITSTQFGVATGLNLASFIAGTAGNILTGPGNILLSVVEGGLLYLQYRVTQPCD